jgi:hypothetical protein
MSIHRRVAAKLMVPGSARTQFPPRRGKNVPNIQCRHTLRRSYRAQYSCVTLQYIRNFAGSYNMQAVYFILASKCLSVAFEMLCSAICWVEELKTDFRQQANKPTGS